MTLGKVLVVGAAEAGKSTLIRALSPSALNLAHHGRTVAMDHGVLGDGATRVALIGVPGQSRFAPVREVLLTGAALALWVHRAGRPVCGDTARLLDPLWSRGVPYLVFVNRDSDRCPTDDWNPPAASPAPRSVIIGSALRPGPELDRLRTEIWSAFGVSHHTKGA